MPMPLLPSADQGSGGHLQQVQPPQLRPHQKPHPALTAAAAAAAEQEHLACPRCDSTNTKFCYYNNYNFSQPRYFCKACRRYWTHGGTLRDIPVGGGTRKNAKRSRILPSSPLPSAPLLLSSAAAAAAGDYKLGGPLQPPPPHASFTSLLSAPGPGFLALGGFGLGLDELGLGKGLWAFPAPVGGCGDPNGGAGGRGIGIGAGWQYESGDHHHLHHHHHQHHHGGFVSAATTAGGGTGDFCSWAEPVISTPASAFK